NMVHQAGKIGDPQERKKFLDWLWDYEFSLYGLPIPDLVYFLDIPVEMNEKLMQKRNNKFTGEEQKDIHENDKEHLKQSYENALSLVEKYHWQRISCLHQGKLKSRQEIHQEIYGILKDIL